MMMNMKCRYCDFHANSDSQMIKHLNDVHPKERKRDLILIKEDLAKVDAKLKELQNFKKETTCNYHRWDLYRQVI